MVSKLWALVGVYQGGFVGLGVFKVDGLQGEVLLDVRHVSLLCCLEQSVTLELI